MNRYYLAIDIGASSGRHILGWVQDGKMQLKEIHRFENRQLQKNGHLVWDMGNLWNGIIDGLKACKKENMIPETVGIDTWGVDYVLLDKDGNMVEWWSADDSRRFNERAQVIIDFFNNISVLPDLKGNGPLTAGENLADHGGLQVAYTALMNVSKNKSSRKISGFTAAQRFFIAYAGVWAGSIREAEIRKRTKMDPHSLGRWRVNGALPHIDAWYDAFNISKEDPLFVPKEQRVTIW